MKNPVAEFHKVITASASAVQTRSEKRDQRFETSIVHSHFTFKWCEKIILQADLIKTIPLSLAGAVFARLLALRHKSFSLFIIHLFGFVEEKRGNLFRSEFVLLKHSTINKLYIFLLAQLESFEIQRSSIESVLMESRERPSELLIDVGKKEKVVFRLMATFPYASAQHFPLRRDVHRKVVPIGLMSDG